MYDSKKDTEKHIESVKEKLSRIAQLLCSRALSHDRSKLEEPEKSVLDCFTEPWSLPYRSEEYNDYLEEMGSALEHHYQNNRHHPEHYEEGVSDMSLIDLVEMFADWCAATERHEDGDILQSIEENSKRFGLGEVLTDIMKNTASELPMGKCRFWSKSAQCAQMED